MDKKEYFMEQALKEAYKAYNRLEVPVGVVIVKDNKIIARAHNQKEEKNNPIKHAEIIAIEKACKKKKTWHLDDCILYVTLEPCKMCLEVIKQARIKQVVYGAKQEKISNLKDPILIQMENVENSSKLLRNFFKNKRK